MSNFLHLTRFGASFSAEFQLCPCSFNSDSATLRQVFLCRPLPLLPCGLYLKACLVMLLGGFLSVWPIHAHFLFLMCMFRGSWFALCQRSSFLTLSNHRMFTTKYLINKNPLNKDHYSLDKQIITKASNKFI